MSDLLVFTIIAVTAANTFEKFLHSCEETMSKRNRILTRKYWDICTCVKHYPYRESYLRWELSAL